MIHSLDRLELGQEIQKRAEKAGRQVEVLVQVNVAAEDTKFGISPENTLGFIRELSRMGNIKVKELMTIAPQAENPEDIRWVFADLRKLLIDIRQENIDNIDMDYLSMGMSNDFEVAIEEGSNIVRVGTAIFGRR
jgi:pyridoxal phosphate enzyme (YggS family)